MPVPTISTPPSREPTPEPPPPSATTETAAVAPPPLPITPLRSRLHSFMPVLPNRVGAGPASVAVAPPVVVLEAPHPLDPLPVHHQAPAEVDAATEAAAVLLTRRAEGYHSFSLVATLLSGFAIRFLREFSHDPTGAMSNGWAAVLGKFLCALVVCADLFGIVVFTLQFYYVKRLLGAALVTEARHFLDHERTRAFRNLALQGVLYSVPAFVTSTGLWYLRCFEPLVGAMLFACAAGIFYTINSLFTLVAALTGSHYLAGDVFAQAQQQQQQQAQWAPAARRSATPPKADSATAQTKKTA